nr:MAG TPA: Replicative helicase [Caudoviricetes sp.]
MEKMIDSIEKNSSIRVEEGDYYVDGLLYCHKCNTPKQVKFEIFGKVRTPLCLCKCAKEKLDREEEARKREEQERRIRDLKRMGFPDAEMQKWTFGKDDCKNAKISKVAHNYVENFREMYKQNKGLLFYGSVGTGKTFISSCIANELIERGFPCLVTNFSRLTNTISGMWEGKQAYIDGLDDFSLLVIDDLASERDTEYMGEIVQSIIDARYRSGQPLIVTTNLTAEELKHPIEIRKQRIYSRLLEMCVPIEVTGTDRRKEKLKNDYDSFKKILEI